MNEKQKRNLFNKELKKLLEKEIKNNPYKQGYICHYLRDIIIEKHGINLNMNEIRSMCRKMGVDLNEPDRAKQNAVIKYYARIDNGKEEG